MRLGLIQRSGFLSASAKRAFTLVEVVVVIAVVVLLSAIIVPLIAKQVDDAKAGRAKNECLVIAAALQQFYKDVGQWPRWGSTYGGNIYGLVSGTAVSSSIPGTATQYGYTADGNDNWYDQGMTLTSRIDILDNHLNANTPKGGAGFKWSTTGEFRWRGPYLPPIGMDPWGHPYSCNIIVPNFGSGAQCVVFCAGINGAIDTAWAAAPVYGVASTTSAPTGDDIWAVVMVVP